MAFRRRFRTRRFGRRFFKKPTEWLDGFSFTFSKPDNGAGITGFPLLPHFDASPAFDGHTVEIPLFPDEGLEAADSYTLLRVVGELMPHVTTVDQQGSQPLAEFGADIRATISSRRLYANAVAVGTEVHPFAFSSQGLGEEDILHTRSWLQPAINPNAPVVPGPFVTIDLLSNMVIHDLSAVLPGAIATSQYNERMVSTLCEPERCMVDISCRRKVTRDTRPFLYFDVLDSEGTPLSNAEAHHLQLRGYLRLLVRKR